MASVTPLLFLSHKNMFKRNIIYLFLCLFVPVIFVKILFLIVNMKKFDKNGMLIRLKKGVQVRPIILLIPQVSVSFSNFLFLELVVFLLLFSLLESRCSVFVQPLGGSARWSLSILCPSIFILLIWCLLVRLIFPIYLVNINHYFICPNFTQKKYRKSSKSAVKAEEEN